ncbi:hypothetical protein H9N25_01555 [Pedobacter riviphilus]|uniref:Uncharacterized protein n=1 Tax=Pedobacter riviphilus TaxID=2766984 RepID=A0ABX6TJU8_9SPHI|nr:hypothetical protein [Pedobacter riviphilus]QNR85213.1 hypothetical protein H9N25_01555 [Pedobacter riviphilus]
MADKTNNISTLFITYLILTTVFLVLLIGFGEDYFFASFNIEIFTLYDFGDLASSQRGLSYLEKSALLVLLPLIITISFIVHSWICDTSTISRTRNAAFVIGLLPFAFLPALINFQEMKMSILLICISLTLLLCLWIVLFHIRMFQFSYLSFHLFASCCLLTIFTSINRIDVDIRHCLNNTKKDSTFEKLDSVTINSPVIFVGSTSSFNLYYSPTQHRSIIVPKNN